eukprot:SAG11_NODE_8229_length_1044_cov_1.678307_1_plen_34_part_10
MSTASTAHGDCLRCALRMVLLMRSGGGGGGGGGG